MMIADFRQNVRKSGVVMHGRNRGAALVVSLIMLVLITLLVITALNIGSSNFRAVSNTQFRDEAIAAADFAVQQVMSSPFTLSPGPEEIDVDLDDDRKVDYVVKVAEPQCISATVAEKVDPSSLALPIEMTEISTWNTVWEVDASVLPADNAAGAAVRVRTGVRVLLDENQKDAVCD